MRQQSEFFAAEKALMRQQLELFATEKALIRQRAEYLNRIIASA